MTWLSWLRCHYRRLRLEWGGCRDRRFMLYYERENRDPHYKLFVGCFRTLWDAQRHVDADLVLHAERRASYYTIVERKR